MQRADAEYEQEEEEETEEKLGGVARAPFHDLLLRRIFNWPASARPFMLYMALRPEGPAARTKRWPHRCARTVWLVQA